MKKQYKIYFSVVLLGMIGVLSSLLNVGEVTLKRFRSANNIDNGLIIKTSDLSSNFTKLTKLGNPIEFSYENNILSNSTMLTGLEEISISASNKDLILSSGYSLNKMKYERHLVNDGTNQFKVYLENECYFAISSIEGETLDIEQVSLKYSCSQNQIEQDDNKLKFAYVESLSGYEVANNNSFKNGDGNNECLIPSYFDDGIHGELPVVRIAKSGFNACYFSRVHIPSSVTVLNTEAFNQCFNLDNVYLPDSVSKVNGYAFSACDTLKDIRLSNNLNTLGDYVFKENSNIESIHLPDSITSIGSATFYSCSKLKEVNCPRGISSIPGSTFYYTTSLESFTITSNIKSVVRSAFRYCDKLSNVSFEGTITEFNKIVSNNYWHSDCPLLSSVSCSDGIATFAVR